MDIQPTSPSHSPQATAWAPDARAGFIASGCLSFRYPGYECDLCADACPIGAIAVEGSAPVLRGDCIGCGQCAAACPSGALDVTGFALPAASLDAEAAELFVDCWRVPFEASPKGALRVPCTGGISLGWLLALCEQAGDRPIHILDRGHCDGCKAGAGVAALRTALTEARILLFQSGVGLEALPTITFSPAGMPLLGDIPESAGEVRMGRRSFFRGLMGGVARSADRVSAARKSEKAPIVLREATQPLDRLRVVTALTAIARRHGREIPGQALPQLSLGECSAHGICAKVCPTGALQHEENSGIAELKFFAARCITCGQCALTCPDQAIRVQATGGNTAFEVLARWEARTCTSCEETFFGAGGDTCPACQKSQQLLQGVAVLFRPCV